MPLKVAIAQAAARSGTGTQDFTDSGAGFSSDVKAAIFIGSNATTADTATGQGHFRLGLAAATGGNTQAAFATISRTSTTTYAATRTVQTAACYTARSGTTTPSAVAAIDSWLSNGIRINWTDASEENELVTALLLGGDIEARVVSGAWAAETAKTISHGLSGAPEVIIAINAIAFGAQCSVGFWATGGTYGYGNLYVEHNVATTNTFSAANTDAILAVKTDGAVARTFTISNVGASTFDCTASSAHTGTLAFLCLRGTSDAITAKAGAFTTKISSTGTEAEVTGMAVAPQVLLALPTLLTSLGALSGDSAYGLIASCNRAGTTQYGGVSLIEDDGITPTTAPPYSRVTADSALVLMGVDGTEDVVATVDSWDSGGVTLNYSNIGASAFQTPYLAFGIQSTTKYLKILADSSAASATGVEVVAYSAPSGSNYVTGTTRYGSTNGQAFEASLESGSAVLKVLASDVGCNSLAAATTVAALARNTTYTTGMVEATIIEE